MQPGKGPARRGLTVQVDADGNTVREEPAAGPEPESTAAVAATRESDPSGAVGYDGVALDVRPDDSEELMEGQHACCSEHCIRSFNFMERCRALTQPLTSQATAATAATEARATPIWSLVQYDVS